MGIDWLTLLAQIINLTVLIWLLKRFLYKPILKIVEARQSLIATEIQQAKDATKEAEAQLEMYQKKVADFDQERNTLFQEAMQEAQNFKDKLTGESKQAIQLSKKNWQQELSQEKQSFDEGLQNAIVANFKTFASDALHDMADEDLSDRIIAKFYDQMKHLSASDRKKFASEVVQTKHIIVQTDTQLDKKTKDDLKKFCGVAQQYDDQSLLVIKIQ
jgi:F-type H+-transporting ATPase subunit b